jgi:hypothetical protein
MRVGFLGLFVAFVFSAAPASADLPPRLACVADGAFFTWYGSGLGAARGFGIPVGPDQKIAGSPASDPQTRLRVDGTKVFLSDDQRPEYFYGDMQRLSFDRYMAGNMVLLSGDGNLTAVAIIADQVSTHTIHLKCVPG